MIITWILLTFVVAFLLVKITLRPKKFPPGPRGLPLLGYGPLLQRNEKLTYRAAARLADTYGPVVGIYFAWMPVVFVNGYNAVKLCLNNSTYDGRPIINTVILGSYNKRLGMIFNDGEVWREQRRFTLRHLRDFGFGRNSLEGTIHDEILEVIEDIKTLIASEPGNIITVTGIFGVSIISILWSVMAGKRLSHDDPQLHQLMKITEQTFRNGKTTGGILNFLPGLRHIAPRWSGYLKMMKNHEALQGYIQSSIDQHKDTMDDHNMRDFLDVYLNELKKNNIHNSFTEEQLIIICSDMFNAGSETTSSFLGFSLLYMVLHPHVQDKVRLELDRIVGRGRLPSLEDRSQLPYTEATLMELYRVTTIAPFTVPHRPMEEVNDLLGYTIPTNAMVLVNIWSVHMDKDHWGDPENFRPERFIDGDGHLVKDDWLIPFGLGKRACIGESLARRTTFLYFTALIQKIEFSNPPHEDLPEATPLPGFTVAPKPFKAKLSIRD